MKALYGLFIADDDEVIRESLKTRFDWPGMGYEVRGLFEDGSDVIACIQALIERGAPLPSVLLTDVVMYDKTGLDAAEYILRNRLPIAVVLLSGYQEFEFAVRGIQCRIYDYLLKPVDPSQLRALFERLAADLDGGFSSRPRKSPPPSRSPTRRKRFGASAASSATIPGPRRCWSCIPSATALSAAWSRSKSICAPWAVCWT